MILTSTLVLSLFLDPGPICKPQTSNDTLPVLPAQQQPAWLQQILAQGQVDAAAYRAYSAAMEAQILAELQSKQIAVDPKFLALLQADRELREGTFAAIYPADARIFQNLQQIWRDLPATTFQKYRHLALGAAVFRREIGVGPIANPPGNFKHGMFNDWAEAAAAAKLTPAEYLAKQKESSKKQAPALSPAASAAIDAFKAKHNKSLDLVWADETLRAELLAALVPLRIEAKAVPELLLQWQIAKGIRPAQRSSTPSVAAYIQALAQKLETPLDLSAATDKKGNKLEWPMFPVAQAPWPVLMGLGLTWPLDESQYIYEKLQGRHGEKRLHLYGPYRHGGDEMTTASLTEIPWASNAWPQQILTGGVCGTMATLAAGSYVSLGVPMYKTGQPGHGNLLTYRANPDGSFYVRVEQSASAGPDGTYTEWPFSDVAHDRTRFAECHMGLALSMNKGLDAWLQSRLALTAFRSLPTEQRAGQGRKILSAALRTNPFNAELWYELADAAPDASSSLQVLKQLPLLITGQATIAQAELKDVNADLSDEKPDDGELLKQEVQFRTLVRDIILQEKFNAVASLSTEQRREVLALAEGPWKANDSRILGALRVRLQLSLQDPAKNLAELRSSVQQALQPGKNARKAEKAALVQLKQLEAALPDAKVREDFLKETLARFNEKNGVSTGKKAKLNPILENIAEQLEDLYSASGRSKEAKALKRQLDGWIKAKT